jgi:hypothetical protein
MAEDEELIGPILELLLADSRLQYHSQYVSHGIEVSGTIG